MGEALRGHRPTKLAAADADAAARSLAGSRPGLVPAGGAAGVEPALGFRRGLMARDGDGHGLRIVER